MLTTFCSSRSAETGAYSAGKGNCGGEHLQAAEDSKTSPAGADRFPGGDQFLLLLLLSGMLEKIPTSPGRGGILANVKWGKL
jgi:hypothetical protein